jgi:hypothetical protein
MAEGTAKRPAIDPGWAPDNVRNGTRVIKRYVWQTPAWEGIRVLSAEELGSGAYLALEWDGEVSAATERAVLPRLAGLSRGACPWVPVSGLGMRQEGPGERPRFAAAAYLASRGPLAAHLAAPGKPA